VALTGTERDGLRRQIDQRRRIVVGLASSKRGAAATAADAVFGVIEAAGEPMPAAEIATLAGMSVPRAAAALRALHAAGRVEAERAKWPARPLWRLLP
jgi:DNA-binding transcriptional regulator GbsR (MarR family)